MYVRKIISQSTVDGPGNRVAVFLQGCNIRCAYCHNPETQPLYQPYMADVSDMSVADIVAEVRKCMPFIRGITVSGGECMLQADQLVQLFEAIKNDFRTLTCLIDSNGTIAFARYPRLLELCDGVMLDVKAWDSQVYQNLTGATNDDIVKENLRLLLQHDKLTEVRIVCLLDESPIKTDVEAVLQHIAATPTFIEKNIPVRLLSFRPYGVVGKLSECPMPSEEQMQRYVALAYRLGLNITIK